MKRALNRMMKNAMLAVTLGAASLTGGLHAQATTAQILTREETAKVMPATVFYRGQSAGIQARNSAGLKLAGDRLVLVAIVDTSGYSSAVAQSYQAYLLTEVPLRLGDTLLAPGAYGFGFVAGGRMVVMDVGANLLTQTTTTVDPKLARPNPLQILPDGTPGHFRLYLGRSYVTVSAEPAK